MLLAERLLCQLRLRTPLWRQGPPRPRAARVLHVRDGVRRAWALDVWSSRGHRPRLRLGCRVALPARTVPHSRCWLAWAPVRCARCLQLRRCAAKPRPGHAARQHWQLNLRWEQHAAGRWMLLLPPRQGAAGRSPRVRQRGPLAAGQASSAPRALQALAAPAHAGRPAAWLPRRAHTCVSVPHRCTHTTLCTQRPHLAQPTRHASPLCTKRPHLWHDPRKNAATGNADGVLPSICTSARAARPRARGLAPGAPLIPKSLDQKPFS
jgi:hypothetical protein